MSTEQPRSLPGILLVILALSLGGSGVAQVKDFDALLGTWDVKMEDGAREFVFEFSLKDGQLTGKYTGASGTVDMADLTFEGHTVKFSVTVGNGMVINYSAIVAEDQLSGTLSLQYGEASITGKRRKMVQG